jgi:hypothetical protein
MFFVLRTPNKFFSDSSTVLKEDGFSDLPAGKTPLKPVSVQFSPMFSPTIACQVANSLELETQKGTNMQLSFVSRTRTIISMRDIHAKRLF